MSDFTFGDNKPGVIYGVPLSGNTISATGATHTLHTPSIPGVESPLSPAWDPLDPAMLGMEGGTLSGTNPAEDIHMPDLDPFLGQIIDDFEAGEAQADEAMLETGEDDTSFLSVGMALPQAQLNLSAPPTIHQQAPVRQSLANPRLASTRLPYYPFRATLADGINPSQPSYTGLISCSDFPQLLSQVTPAGRHEYTNLNHRPVAPPELEKLRAAEAMREEGEFAASRNAPASTLNTLEAQKISATRESSAGLHARLPEEISGIKNFRHQSRSLPPMRRRNSWLRDDISGNPTEPAQPFEMATLSGDDGHVPEYLLEEFMGVLELRGEQEALRFLRQARASQAKSPDSWQLRHEQSSAGKRDQVLSLDDVFNPGDNDFQNHALAFGNLRSGDVMINDDPAAFGITEIRNVRNQVVFHRRRVSHNDNSTGAALAIDIHIEDDLVGAAEASAPVDKFRRLMKSTPKKEAER